MASRPVVLITRVVIVVGLLAPSAAARPVQNGRWTFDPRISEGDPVNLIWYGGSLPRDDVGVPTDAACTNYDVSPAQENRSAFCAQVHTSTGWLGKSSKARRMLGRTCNGTAGKSKLDFFNGRTGRRTKPADGQLSTADTCRFQYHVRFWGDDVVDSRPQFVVSAIHVESRGRFKSGHNIVGDWEFAESTYVRILRRYGGDKTQQCVQPDWRRLPGSGGTFNNYKSDGKISRISFQAPLITKPRGEDCPNA